MSFRLELLKNIIKEAKAAKLYDYSYSAILRYLRKEQPENVRPFLEAFKSSFDEAYANELEDFKEIALMQACKAIDLDAKSLL